MIEPREAIPTAAVARHYNELDEFYREVWGDHVHHGLWISGREKADEAVVQLIESVADAARIQPESQVCDVGCGYGGTSRHLVNTRRAHVTGYTVSEVQYEYANRQHADSPFLDYRLCRWEDNDLPDASMDAALSIECFTHVADKQAFLAELYRVLKPSGRAALTVWMHRPGLSRWQVRHMIEPICYEGRLAGIGSASEYLAMMNASGLIVEEHQDWSRQVRRTWSICLQRLATQVLTSSRYRAAIFDRGLENRVFAMTLLRILVAYHLGVMRYGFFSLRRP